MGAGWFLLGVPWDCSGTGRGERHAPAALRAAGMTRLVDRDLGDVAIEITSSERDPYDNVLALRATVRAARTLSDVLAEALRAEADRRPLVVGGDCSILLGIVPALRRVIGPVGLWFLDGHPDYLDGGSSETGETADMDLAVLTGRGASALVDLAGEAPMIRARHAFLLGHRTRNLDDEGQAELRRLPDQLPRIDAETLLVDPAGAGREAEAMLIDAGVGVWLHVDLDVLDPASLPAVTYPQPGGPHWDQLTDTLAPLAGSRRLLGLSIADLRPDLDPGGVGARRVVELLEHVLP